MGKRSRIALFIIAAIALALVLVATAARLSFERRIAREGEELLAGSTTREPAIVTEEDLAPLPEPVQRWLRWANVVGKPFPATVRLTQEGQFRLGRDRRWMPFTAEEVFTTDPPGFVWATRMQMFPGVAIVGRDRYTESGCILPQWHGN